MNEVTDALAPIQDGFRAENCFLFGPSGPILLRNASKLAAEAPFVKFSDSKNSDISVDQGMMTRAMIQFGKMMESESRLS